MRPRGARRGLPLYPSPRYHAAENAALQGVAWMINPVEAIAVLGFFGLVLYGLFIGLRGLFA